MRSKTLTFACALAALCFALLCFSGCSQQPADTNADSTSKSESSASSVSSNTPIEITSGSSSTTTVEVEDGIPEETVEAGIPEETEVVSEEGAAQTPEDERKAVELMAEAEGGQQIDDELAGTALQGKYEGDVSAMDGYATMMDFWRALDEEQNGVSE